MIWSGRVAVFRDGRPGTTFSDAHPGTTFSRFFKILEDASRVTGVGTFQLDESAKSLGREARGVLIAGLNSEKRDLGKARRDRNSNVAAQIQSHGHAKHSTAFRQAGSKGTSCESS